MTSQSWLAATNTLRQVGGVLMIPARLESTRLPRKLLLHETGKSVLEHTIERAQDAISRACSRFLPIVVACDHPVLASVAEHCGVSAVLTDQGHPNGTRRIAEAVQQLSLESQIEFVINLQADQPECFAGDIIRLAELLMSDPTNEMATLAAPWPADEILPIHDANVVQVAVDSQLRAVEFSRSPEIVGSSDAHATPSVRWLRHVGIYAYRLATLIEIAERPVSPAEATEQLEQLGPLHAGKLIRVMLVADGDHPRPIDTANDYRAFVKRWRAQCDS